MCVRPHSAFLLQIVQDVTADPTLPRTKDVRCPQCNHNEAVFVSQNTESGMTLYFNCVNCR
jgi:DNA-directed RNA polymerase II subunit RPB9